MMKSKPGLSMKIDVEEEMTEINLTTSGKLLANEESSSLSPLIPIPKQPDSPHHPEKIKILKLNSPILMNLLDYMEGPNNVQDLSYHWIEKDNNLRIINKNIFITQKLINEILSKRDIVCELKLLKLITEDKLHHDKLLKVPKRLNKQNRYSDIHPYQYNICCLKNDTSNLDQNYFNASYIQGPVLEADKDLFVATQGPVLHSIERFWRIIRDKEIRLIVMLCNLEEECNRKKCEQYWPKEQGETDKYTDFEVSLTKEEVLLENAIIQREITYKQGEDEFSVTQLQVTCWPDYLVPESEIGYKTIDLLIMYVHSYRDRYSKSPILVHCSAGLGRTGTFIAIFNIIRCLTEVNKYNNQNDESGIQKIKPFFSVFNVVRKLKEQRMGSVITDTQYRYVYEFCLEFLKRNFM